MIRTTFFLCLLIVGCTVAQYPTRYVMHCSQPPAAIVNRVTTVMSGAGYQVMYKDPESGVVQVERQRDDKVQSVSFTVSDSIQVTMKAQVRNNMNGRPVTIEYDDQMIANALRTELEQISEFCQ